MKVKVILNPYANRWGAKERVAAVRDAFAVSGVQADLVVTSVAGQGKPEAIQAVKHGYDAVVAAGGDGTVNEVVNGLIVAAGDKPTVPLGVLPIGTGNDMADMAGLPRGLETAVSVIVNGKSRQIDAGRVNNHFFHNNCAVAMEPMVTVENNKITNLSGNIRYIVALVKALAKLKAWHMKITWDGGGYEGPSYLLSVCNSPRTGGIFYMAPQARLDDGVFDFVFAPEVPKRTVLVILARLFRKTHITHPNVTYGRTAHLTIHSTPGTPIHADGELLTESETAVTYEILPGKITLFTP